MQNSMTMRYPTLIDTLWADDGRSDARTLMRYALLAIGGSLLIWLTAKIQVPFYPVPMTMQTFAVLAIAAAFGSRLGTATIILYLAQGAVGLPVFTGTPEKGIGIAYMMGPTGGYLLGYIMAAFTIGWLAERGWDRNVFTTAAAMFVGTVLMYVPGLLYLGVLFGWDKPILEWGLYPFILGDAAKLALAASVLPLGWHFLKRK